MRIARVAADAGALFDVDGDVWRHLPEREIDLVPAPVTLAAGVSGQMALSQGHGKVSKLSTRMAHNGTVLSIFLTWKDSTKDDRIVDLDGFSDAAAVMFPLEGDANPITMGDEERPVNAWLWRADRGSAFDVIAFGYSTSERRQPGASGLRVNARHGDGWWSVVFQRPILVEAKGFSRFEPGKRAKVAFAVWEGRNGDRSGQKAVSGAFTDLDLDR